MSLPPIFQLMVGKRLVVSRVFLQRYVQMAHKIHIIINVQTTDNSKILMQEMSQKLRESLCLNQELSEVNHNLQEELRKVLTDLSDITRLNQQLSIENDNLRNRGGWILREQQEKLERKIADVQDQNSRMNRLVNMSNVTAYEKMRRERDDALNQVAEERQKTFMAKKNFREDINKVNKKTNDKVLDMKNRMQFWQIVSIGTLIVGFLIGWIL